MPRQLPPHIYCGRYRAVITPHDDGWGRREVSKRGRGEGISGAGGAQDFRAEGLASIRGWVGEVGVAVVVQASLDTRTHRRVHYLQ